MLFNIETVAKDYINKRYTKASLPEREKYIQDWIKKVETSRKTIPDVEKRVGQISGKKIIDVGSGMGGVMVAFLEKGADVYGVEVEKELYDISIELIKSYNFEPKVKLYDGKIFPYEKDFFDLAYSASVLEHTDDPVLYLVQILQSLKNGGKLYLAFPNKLWYKETHTGIYFLTYFHAFLRPLIIKILRRNPLEENNLHFYSMFDLIKFVEKNNSESKDGYIFKFINEEGETNSGIKYYIKNFLKLVGLSYKYFMPHVSVILVKDKIS